MIKDNLEELERVLNITSSKTDFEVSEIRYGKGKNTETTVNWYFV